MTTLTLTLHYPPAEMPDADTDVLIWAEGEQEAQLGAYVGDETDGPVWIGAQGEIVPRVVAWTNLPCLPAARSVIAGRIGREPELVLLANGLSIDLGARWSMPA